MRSLHLSFLILLNFLILFPQNPVKENWKQLKTNSGREGYPLKKWTLLLENNSVDVVFSSETFEHIFNLEEERSTEYIDRAQKAGLISTRYLVNSYGRGEKHGNT
mgnify:CR=1 FL=1